MEMIVFFIAMGVLGGIAHVLVDAKSWEDIQRFSAFKTVGIGAIVGMLYAYLHSDYSFPNGVMSFVAGYFGTDFLLKIVERFGEGHK